MPEMRPEQLPSDLKLEADLPWVRGAEKAHGKGDVPIEERKGPEVVKARLEVAGVIFYPGLNEDLDKAIHSNIKNVGGKIEWEKIHDRLRNHGVDVDAVVKLRESYRKEKVAGMKEEIPKEYGVWATTEGIELQRYLRIPDDGLRQTLLTTWMTKYGGEIDKIASGDELWNMALEGLKPRVVSAAATAAAKGSAVGEPEMGLGKGEKRKSEILESDPDKRIEQLIRLARDEIRSTHWDSRGSLRFETIIEGVRKRFYGTTFEYVDIFKAKIGEREWDDDVVKKVLEAVKLEINGRCNLRITEMIEVEDFATALKNNWSGSLEKYVTEMKGGQLTVLGEEVWEFFNQLEEKDRKLFEDTQKKLQLITQLGMFGLMWGDLGIRQKAVLADAKDKDDWWKNKYVKGRQVDEKTWEGEDLTDEFYALLRSWGCDELVGEIRKGGVLRDYFVKGKMPIAGINKAEFERASEILLGGEKKGDAGELALQVFWGTKLMGQFFSGYHLGQLIHFDRSSNFLADKVGSWSGSRRGRVTEYGVDERNGIGFYELDDAGNIDTKKKYSRHKVGLMGFDKAEWVFVNEDVREAKEKELKGVESELRGLPLRGSKGRKVELTRRRDALRNFLKVTERGRHSMLKIRKGPLDPASELKYGTTLPLADAFLEDNDWHALSVGPMNQLVEVKKLEVGTEEEIRKENAKVDKAVIVGRSIPKSLYDSARSVNPWYLIWAMDGTFLRNVNLRSLQATRIGSTIEQNAFTAVSTGFELKKKLKELGKFGIDPEVKTGPENAYALLLGILADGKSQITNGVMSTEQLKVYFRKEMDNILYGIDPRNRQFVDYSLSMKALRFWTPEQFNTFVQAIVSEPEVVGLVGEAELITYVEKIKDLRRQSLDAMREVSTGLKEDLEAIAAAEDAERKILPFELGERVVSYPKSMQARSLELGWRFGRFLTGRK